MSSRRNRRVKSASMRGGTLGGCVAFFLMVFAAVMIYGKVYTDNAKISRTIQKLERECAKLEQNCRLEQRHWDEMNTPSQLGEKLNRHLLAMSTPKAEQQIHMNARGMPVNGLAVARARSRAKSAAAEAVAMDTVAVPVPSRSAANVRNAKRRRQ